MRSYPNAAYRVRIEMVRCGYTTASLSAQSDISESVLRGILTGRSKTVSTRTACALAKAFDYPLPDFIDLLSSEK